MTQIEFDNLNFQDKPDIDYEEYVKNGYQFNFKIKFTTDEGKPRRARLDRVRHYLLTPRAKEIVMPLYKVKRTRGSSERLYSKLLATLLVPIFNEAKPVFLFGKTTMNELLEEDELCNRGKLSGTEFKKFRDYLINNRIIKQLRPSVCSFQEGVYEILDERVLALLKERFGEDVVDECRANALKVYDTYQQTQMNEFSENTHSSEAVEVIGCNSSSNEENKTSPVLSNDIEEIYILSLHNSGEVLNANKPTSPHHNSSQPEVTAASLSQPSYKPSYKPSYNSSQLKRITASSHSRTKMTAAPPSQPNYNSSQLKVTTASSASSHSHLKVTAAPSHSQTKMTAAPKFKPSYTSSHSDVTTVYSTSSLVSREESIKKNSNKYRRSQYGRREFENKERARKLAQMVFEYAKSIGLYSPDTQFPGIEYRYNKHEESNYDSQCSLREVGNEYDHDKKQYRQKHSKSIKSKSSIECNKEYYYDPIAEQLKQYEHPFKHEFDF